MKKSKQVKDANTDEDTALVSYKLQYAKELVAEFLISCGWNVFVSVNPVETSYADLISLRGNIRPSLINVIVRNKTKVPESQAMSEEVREKIIAVKKNTTYTVYTFFIDELCGDVYGVNGNCPPDFTRGKIKSKEAFWELKTMKFMFKLSEEKRKLLRSFN